MIEEVTKEYLDGLITLSCDLSPLHEFRTEAKEEGIPIITKDVERLISILLKSSNSKRLFEVGSAVGYSACVFAQNMGKDSYVKTVERDEIRYIPVSYTHLDVYKRQYYSISIYQMQAFFSFLLQ